MDKERRNKSVDEGDYESLNPQHRQRSEKRNEGAWKIAAIALGIIGSILLVIGICLYLSSEKTIGNKMDIDYTDCTDDTIAKNKCDDRVKLNKSCFCLLDFELMKSIEGPTFLYYKTPGIRTSESYKDSRDDNQLAGILSSTPSASCGDFRMDNGKPIAPCGEIADSYLEDTFDIYSIETNKYLPSSKDGLNGITEEDKKHYRNPPGDLDLETAFKDFAKPKSWTNNIWDLDKSKRENNGFQNEKFIGWMKQDLTLKPALRFNHTGIYKDGIPAGNYTFRIDYTLSKYVDQRILVLSSERQVIDESYQSAGIALIVIGVLLLVGFLVAVVFLYLLRKKNVGY